MKTITTIALLYLIQLLFACNNPNHQRSRRNDQFLKKYGTYQFDNFKNYSVFVREWNQDGDPVIMILNDRIDTGDCSLPFTITIDHTSNEAKTIMGNWTDSTGKCLVDTVKMIRLAAELSRLQAVNIHVDTNNTVFVQNRFGEEGPDLVRFSSSKFVTKDIEVKWRSKGNGWYERKTSQ